MVFYFTIKNNVMKKTKNNLTKKKQLTFYILSKLIFTLL